MTSSNATGIRPLTTTPVPPEPRPPSSAELTVLYTRYASKVTDMTGRLVGVLIEDAASDLADDLVQEVWLRAAAGAVDPDTAAADLADLVRLVVAQHDIETRTRPVPSGLLLGPPWSERLDRTCADITALLTAGSGCARAYGAGAGSTRQAA